MTLKRERRGHDRHARTVRSESLDLLVVEHVQDGFPVEQPRRAKGMTNGVTAFASGSETRARQVTVPGSARGATSWSWAIVDSIASCLPCRSVAPSQIHPVARQDRRNRPPRPRWRARRCCRETAGCRDHDGLVRSCGPAQPRARRFLACRGSRGVVPLSKSDRPNLSSTAASLRCRIRTRKLPLPYAGSKKRESTRSVSPLRRIGQPQGGDVISSGRSALRSLASSRCPPGHVDADPAPWRLVRLDVTATTAIDGISPPT